MKHGGLEGIIRGKDGDLFVGSTENFVNIVGDDGLPCGAGDGD